MDISLRTAAAIASAFIVSACVADVSREEIADHSASIDDSAPEQESAAHVEWAHVPRAQLPPEIPIECTSGFAPFVCEGSCAPGEGCCITGLRPLGVCSPFDECPYRCLIDCAEAARSRSAHEGAHCVTLCTWLSPEPSCRTR